MTAEAEVTALRVTLDTRDPIWELPPVNISGHGALIGWVNNSQPVDDGIPHQAALLLMRARRSSAALPSRTLRPRAKPSPLRGISGCTQRRSLKPLHSCSTVIHSIGC